MAHHASDYKHQAFTRKASLFGGRERLSRYCKSKGASPGHPTLKSSGEYHECSILIDRLRQVVARLWEEGAELFRSSTTFVSHLLPWPVMSR